MDIIRDISDFIFIEDEPQKADIIFIPGGSSPRPAERAAELWRFGFAPLILPSGRPRDGSFVKPKSQTDLYDGAYETEWDFMKDVLVKSGVDEKAVLMEKNSTDTFKNAFFSKEVTDSLGLTVGKAIICCKAFHARRCLMTYACAYPQTEFIICPSERESVNKSSWYNNPEGISRVMSELQKCGQYFKDAVPSFRDKK